MRRGSVEDILQREHERRMVTTLPADLRAAPPMPYRGKKRGPKKRITDEMAAAWSVEQRFGTTYATIAQRTGFHEATVVRAVTQWRKAQRSS